MNKFGGKQTYYEPSCSYDEVIVSDSIGSQYSAEKQQQLAQQLKQAEQDKKSLHKQLDEKDQIIIDLHSQVDDLNDIINSDHAELLGKGSNLASSKIIELSKKNRQMKAELESFKCKYNQLFQKTEKLRIEAELRDKDKDKECDNEKIQKKLTCPIPQSEICSLTEQLNTTKCKLFEALNQNNQLKNELKVAQKCIQQEIGENVNLAVLAAANSTWRGRAQQIISLQNKISDLNRKLDQNNCNVEPKHIIKKAEAFYKMELEQIQKDSDALKQTLEEQNTKISALKTRNKVICDEATSYKLKTMDLLEKSENDDKYIQVLNEQLNVQRFQYESKIDDLVKRIERNEIDKEYAERSVEEIEIKVQNRELVLKEKETEMEKYRNEIKLLEENLRAICGDFLFQCKDLKKDEFMGILNAIESEKESMLVHMQTVDNRLQEERERLIAMQDNLNKMRIKYNRLDAKYKAEVVKSEKLKAKHAKTNRMMDYARQTYSSAKMQSSTSESSDFVRNEEESLMIEIEDLRHRLDFANEKIKFLEEQINILQMEKDRDSKLFSDIISNSKFLLLQVINQNQNGMSTLDITNDLIPPTNTEIFHDTDQSFFYNEETIKPTIPKPSIMKSPASPEPRIEKSEPKKKAKFHSIPVLITEKQRAELQGLH